MDIGKPLPLLPWWNLERSFCVGETLVLHFRETSGCFRGDMET